MHGFRVLSGVYLTILFTWHLVDQCVGWKRRQRLKTRKIRSRVSLFASFSFFLLSSPDPRDAEQRRESSERGRKTIYRRLEILLINEVFCSDCEREGMCDGKGKEKGVVCVSNVCVAEAEASVMTLPFCCQPVLPFHRRLAAAETRPWSQTWVGMQIPSLVSIIFSSSHSLSLVSPLAACDPFPFIPLFPAIKNHSESTSTTLFRFLFFPCHPFPSIIMMAAWVAAAVQPHTRNRTHMHSYTDENIHTHTCIHMAFSYECCYDSLV